VSLHTASPPLRQVRGPSAISGGFKRFAVLTHRIALMDFKLRFFGSVLGYLWQLMRPLMLFGVLYLIFTTVVKFDAPHYPVMLLLGIVLFTFLAESVSGAVSSVFDRENLVRKIQFPRLVIPLAVVLTAMFSLGLNLVVVFIFALAQQISPRWSWLELFPLVGLLIVLTTGFAMLVSALYVRMRDVRPISDVLLQIGFYTSPILFPIEKITPEELREAMIILNPFAAILQQLRHAIVDPTSPSAAAAAGGAVRLLIPLGIIVAVFAIGFRVFNRAAPRIAEDL
jgi:ABC-2 type transport system permease protein